MLGYPERGSGLVCGGPLGHGFGGGGGGLAGGEGWAWGGLGVDAENSGGAGRMLGFMSGARGLLATGQ